ncbi:MAG: hypothetical protein GWN30_37620 [Gammaproteobacteria bacterium]|nr:hypothetical protein [Gammaproteobacteria bacterium]
METIVEEKPVVVEDSPSSPLVEDATDPVEPDPEDTQEIIPPSLEDIREFLGIDASDETEDVDLDSFWDNALEESEKGSSNTGMSLEEARKQGLIPTEFDQPGQSKESE